MTTWKTMAVMLIVVLVGAACGAPPSSSDDEIDIDEPQRPSLPAGERVEENPIQIDEPEEATEAVAEDVSRMSDEYDGLELVLVDVMVQANDEGTATGELELTLTLRNTGDAELELPFVEADYQLVTDTGLTFGPAAIDDALLEPTIAPGDEVTGTLDYTTEQSLSSYSLEVSTFDDILVDASVQPESIDAAD